MCLVREHHEEPFQIIGVNLELLQLKSSFCQLTMCGFQLKQQSIILSAIICKHSTVPLSNNSHIKESPQAHFFHQVSLPRVLCSLLALFLYGLVCQLYFKKIMHFYQHNCSHNSYNCNRVTRPITSRIAASTIIIITINLNVCAFLFIYSFLQGSLEFVIFTTKFHEINLMLNACLHQSCFFQLLYLHKQTTHHICCAGKCNL